MVLTEQEWLEWKQLDVTQEFFKNLKKAREKIKEDVINGLYANDEFAKGKATCIQELLELDYNEFMEGSK